MYHNCSKLLEHQAKARLLKTSSTVPTWRQFTVGLINIRVLASLWHQRAVSSWSL